MTNLEKYKIICKLYKDVFRTTFFPDPWMDPWVSIQSFHTHHIKPKSIYPDLKDDEDNKVELPSIVHAAAHHFLSKFAEETNDERFRNIHYADVVGFINKNLKDSVFSFDNNVADEIFSSIVGAYRELVQAALNRSKEYEKDRLFITCFVKEKGLSVVNVKIIGRHDSISKQLTLDEVNENSTKFEVYRCCFQHDKAINPEKPSTVERHQKYLLLSKYPYYGGCISSFYECMDIEIDRASCSLQKKLDDILECHSTSKKDILDLDVPLTTLLDSNDGKNDDTVECLSKNYLKKIKYMI